MKRKIVEYIKESQTVKRNHYKIHGYVDLFIVHRLSDNINVENVIDKLESILSRKYFYGVDVIYIARIPEFKKREINALYKDGAIYISPNQDSEEDMMDDFIHEVSHSVETYYQDFIYSDGEIKKEFLGKRKRLYHLMSQDNINVDMSDFLNVHYSKEFDFFLYKDVGYNRIDGHVSGLFLSPYSVTSMREYFATGFEEYFLGDRIYLKKISPQVYRKIKNMEEEKSEV